MSNRIIGVDLGAYSVKVVVGNPGFRQAVLTECHERLIPPGDEPFAERAAKVFGALMKELRVEHDSLFFVVGGHKMFVHVIEFGFKNLKRVDLERVVGGELEGILPLDLEDMVFAFDELPNDLAAITPIPVVDGRASSRAEGMMEEEEPTAVRDLPEQAPAVVRGIVAAPIDGTRVLTCAMPKARAEALIDLGDAHKAEPRGIIASPAAYCRVVERLVSLGDQKQVGPVAIIDIGHEETTVAVVKDGRAVFLRSIVRGGDHLTKTIAKSWRLSYAEAENAKHSDSFIASSAEPASSEAWRRIHDVFAAELEPLARDLRQTLNTCRAKTGATIGTAVVIGGGAKIRGIASFLTEQLGISVVRATQADADAVLGPKLTERGLNLDTAALAAGVVLEGGTGRPGFDLRQGELAYRVDLSFLRAKAGQIAAAALVLVAFFAANSYAALYKLRKAERTLTERLAIETTELFGQTLSASDAQERVLGETPQPSPLPKMTAYDMLIDMNSRIPDGKTIVLDVLDLELKQGKITMKATAGTTDEIDKLEEALKGQKCFEEVTRGNISAGPEDKKDFSVSIKTNCMF